MNRNAKLIIGIFSGLLWGLNDVFTRMVSLNITQNTVYTVIIFSLLLAFLQDSYSSLSILAYRSFKKNLLIELKHSKLIIYLLFFAAIFAGPLGMCTAIIGVDYAGPVYAGAITASYPIVTFLLALFLTREKNTLIKTIGTFLAVFAIIAISIEGEKSNVANLTFGLIFAGIAMFGWGMESIILDIAYRKTNLDTSLLLAIRQFFSASSYLIILLSLFLIHGYLNTTIKQTLHNPALILLCVVTASTSYLTYYYAIKTMGASIATLFNATFVFWDALFTWTFGLGTINNFYWFWATLLVAGIYLVELNVVIKNKKQELNVPSLN